MTDKLWVSGLCDRMDSRSDRYRSGRPPILAALPGFRPSRARVQRTCRGCGPTRARRRDDCDAVPARASPASTLAGSERCPSSLRADQPRNRTVSSGRWRIPSGSKPRTDVLDDMSTPRARLVAKRQMSVGDRQPRRPDRLPAVGPTDFVVRRIHKCQFKKCSAHIPPLPRARIKSSSGASRSASPARRPALPAPTRP